MSVKEAESLGIIRFGRVERQGKVDVILLISMTWGFCSLMVSALTAVPAGHFSRGK